MPMMMNSKIPKDNSMSYCRKTKPWKANCLCQDCELILSLYCNIIFLDKRKQNKYKFSKYICCTSSEVQRDIVKNGF